MKRVTIRDIAREANVSHITVSRVLSQREDIPIAETTRERVLEVARAMGYRINPAARALVTGRTHMIGLWTWPVLRPYYASVFNQLQILLFRDGYRVVVVDAHERTEHDGSLKVPLWPVDGLFLTYSPAHLQSYEQSLFSIERPVVGLNWIVSTEEAEQLCEKIATSFVGLDYYPACVEAAQHLVRQERRRIAFLSVEDTRHTDSSRARAYEEVMTAAGRPTEFIIVARRENPNQTLLETFSDPRQRIAHAVKQYGEANGFPDAILCWNDDMALGTYRALRDAGLRVPDDVALVGCDGIQDTNYCDPPLSTIVTPIEEMCRLGWQFLRERLENPGAAFQHAVLQPQFLARGSSLSDN